jgi:hypothetical protein
MSWKCPCCWRRWDEEPTTSQKPTREDVCMACAGCKPGQCWIQKREEERDGKMRTPEV